MAKDSIADRFAKTLQMHKLAELGKRRRSKEDLEAEEELLKKTEKVKPLHADQKVNRNAPCPCGSGKKFKKCCEGKSDKEIDKTRRAREADEAKKAKAAAEVKQAKKAAAAEKAPAAKKTAKKPAKKPAAKKTAKKAAKKAK